MKKFLKELKSLQPKISESLQLRILHDAKPTISVKRSSFSFGSFFVGTSGGVCIGICIGLLLGMVLFSSVKSPEIVETPPVIEPEVHTNDAEPLELDRLIAQIDKRNRIWEKTTIPAYSTKIGVRPKIELFLE